MFLNLEIFTKFHVLYHNSAKIGHIPEPAAPDDLLVSSSVFCACHTYVWCACTSAWKLAPQGLIPFYYAFFYLNTTN